MPSVRPSSSSPSVRHGVPRLRRRVATAAAAVALAIGAFLPGDSLFGDSAPASSQVRTVAPATTPVR
jgi:outer membrane protein TolC